MSDRRAPDACSGRPQTLTVAAVLQIGPDYVLLTEAENTQSAASHAGVSYHPGVCHQV